MSDYAFWTEEWSRIYLQLMLEQKNNGNWKGNNLSSIGKRNVVEQFSHITGNSWNWSKFKNRYEWFRKHFEMYRELTSRDDSRELVIDPESGCLSMGDAWWEKKLKDFPRAAMKLRKNPLHDILLLEKVFHGTTVAAYKGWRPSIEPKGSDPNPLEVDSGDSNHPSSDQKRNNSSSEKRTKPVDQSTSDTRPAKKPNKKNNNNVISESLPKSTTENSLGKDPYGITSCMEVLCDLKEVNMGCRLWWAAVDLFEQRAEKRETFVAIPSQELRAQWLERTLGISRHDHGS
ncbi:PREDICTED: uncharacterized protein LOC104827195 isoform X2 [Tarenaya hassleriana]|nr:PREDICTED: uncharacterized protein LOC104827195 isoform X2 [Tarenaya hassleriana]XP_010558614.1 PREDICTED: uncharacterized protein LOC104827195 isoform X2 [Tarenaya hassleriana]XP_010558615.1 PREDICTED: uncharacterized protein LOC104827195 isoform X2 [Tarenaya hassleriana]XP_010558616.1 PREDICTED: uncharacterized protein LOC104827195 isoform X2 [Tarenaya hassleriana]